jgi:hypothetical protein
MKTKNEKRKTLRPTIKKPKIQKTIKKYRETTNKIHKRNTVKRSLKGVKYGISKEKSELMFKLLNKSDKKSKNKSINKRILKLSKNAINKKHKYHKIDVKRAHKFNRIRNKDIKIKKQFENLETRYKAKKKAYKNLSKTQKKQYRNLAKNIKIYRKLNKKFYSRIVSKYVIEEVNYNGEKWFLKYRDEKDRIFQLNQLQFYLVNKYGHAPSKVSNLDNYIFKSVRKRTYKTRGYVDEEAEEEIFKRAFD